LIYSDSGEEDYLKTTQQNPVSNPVDKAVVYRKWTSPGVAEFHMASVLAALLVSL
jgi:hypothetical protein